MVKPAAVGQRRRFKLHDRGARWPQMGAGRRDEMSHRTESKPGQAATGRACRITNLACSRSAIPARQHEGTGRATPDAAGSGPNPGQGKGETC